MTTMAWVWVCKKEHGLGRHDSKQENMALSVGYSYRRIH